MLTVKDTFQGFSVDDLEAARMFYGDRLGLEATLNEMGLELRLPDGRSVFVYPKADHEPATFTILNFVVPDIDAAVDELGAAGVELERYEGLHQDEKGVMRGKAAGMGPDIAWFTDPAGNVLAVLAE
jgi:catechol 2,3-dioxygenase-like lactoylglutathione lyase family enzyme